MELRVGDLGEFHHVAPQAISVEAAGWRRGQSVSIVLGRQSRPDEAAIPRLGGHLSVRSDALPSEEGPDRPIRQFIIVVRTPGYGNCCRCPAAR